MTEVAKKQYYAIDLMKFLLAILLVCAHVSSEKLSFPVYIDIWFSFYIVAVPFFFTTSAFFFFQKIVNEKDPRQRTHYYLHYTKRILLMYLMWSLIYTVFKLATWVQTGSFSWEEFGKHVYYSIVYSSYATIWFLPALWVAVSLVYFCMSLKMSIHAVLLFALCMYVLGWMCYTLTTDLQPFPGIVEWYERYFQSPRNGVFNGFVFAALGGVMSIKQKTMLDRSCLYYYTLSVVFAVLFVAEALLTKRFVNPVIDANFLFSLIPFTYFFVMALAKTELRPHSFYKMCRNLSLLLFLSQRIFITAIPLLLPENVLVVITQNAYLGLFVFLGVTMAFSVLIVKFSNRYKFLKMLW